MKNVVKEKLRRGEAVVGILCALANADITEWIAKMGYDWCFLDAEHGPMGYERLLSMMQAMSGTDCTPMVRVQWNEAPVVKRVLDIGAHGIVVPMVNTKEEAEMAVKACKYPPKGIRGYSPRRFELLEPDYWKTANDETMVVVQVESGQSVKNLVDILSVDGVDACFVGHFDLSINTGLPLPPTLPPKNNPGLAEALDKVLAASKKTGKPAGMLGNMNSIKWILEKGFKFNMVGEVDQLFFDAAKMALDVAKGRIKV